MSSRNTPLERIDAAWGLVAEKIASDPKVVEAVTLLLGWEQDRVAVSHLPGVPSDIAYPEVCSRLGEVEGLARAIEALTDASYIASRREHIETQMKEAQKNVRRSS